MRARGVALRVGCKQGAEPVIGLGVERRIHVMPNHHEAIERASGRAADYSSARSAHPLSVLGALGAGQVTSAEKVRAFWRRIERYGPGVQVRQDLGAPSERLLIIISGWACDMRILPDGRRQIFSFLLPGDTIEARGGGSIGIRGVVALTRLEVVDSGRQLAAEADRREALIQALNEAAQRTEQRLYDHIVRMGRLSAKERLIHLLLELCERLEKVGLVDCDTFKIPLTQEIFADALGLSVVHVNRTLKTLRKEGLVQIKCGSVTLFDRPKLARVSCYRSPSDDPGSERAVLGQALDGKALPRSQWLAGRASAQMPLREPVSFASR
jgi:CRP-like cAMP-binding protein